MPKTYSKDNKNINYHYKIIMLDERRMLVIIK